MKSIVLSPSTLSLFLECPRCFWLQLVKGIKRPDTGFPTLPSGMDKILKEHFDKHRAENSHPEELKDLKGNLYPNLEKLKEWRNSMIGLRFTDKETGAILRGAIDDLFVTDQKKYAPIDFKTRGYPVKENTPEISQHQMDIYALLLERNSHPPANFAILLYYHPLCVNTHCNIEFHAETVRIKTSIENGEELFRKAVETLNGEIPKKSENCAFCNWNTNFESIKQKSLGEF